MPDTKESKDAGGPSGPPPSYESSTATPTPRLPTRFQPLDIPILKYLKSKRVILASASPRRRSLLAQIGLTNLEILPSTKPEDVDKKTHGPHEYVAATALQKCLDVYEKALQPPSTSTPTPSDSADKPDDRDPALVISADTVVVSRDGRILEKPRNRADHVRMLRHLRDTRVHTVMTAVCVLAPREDARHPGYELATYTEETKVYFAKESDGLPDDVIDAYVATNEGVDKAGGYAVQGVGGMVLVEKVEGPVDNVVGLPVRRCLAMAEKVVFRQDESEDDEESDEE